MGKYSHARTVIHETVDGNVLVERNNFVAVGYNYIVQLPLPNNWIRNVKLPAGKRPSFAAAARWLEKDAPMLIYKARAQ